MYIIVFHDVLIHRGIVRLASPYKYVRDFVWNHWNTHNTICFYNIACELRLCTAHHFCVRRNKFVCFTP